MKSRVVCTVNINIHMHSIILSVQPLKKRKCCSCSKVMRNFNMHVASGAGYLYIYMSWLATKDLQPTAPVFKAGHPGVLFFVVGLFFGC